MTSRRRLAKALCLASLLVSPEAAWSQDRVDAGAVAAAAQPSALPEGAGCWDDAGVLLPPQRRSVDTAIATLAREQRIALAVVLVPHVEAASVEESALGRFRAFRSPGDRRAMLYVATSDRKNHIVVGSDLRDRLTDDDVRRALEDEFRPVARTAGVGAATARTVDVMKAHLSGAALQRTAPGGGDGATTTSEDADGATIFTWVVCSSPLWLALLWLVYGALQRLRDSVTTMRSEARRSADHSREIATRKRAVLERKSELLRELDSLAKTNPGPTAERDLQRLRGMIGSIEFAQDWQVEVARQTVEDVGAALSKLEPACRRPESLLSLDRADIESKAHDYDQIIAQTPNLTLALEPSEGAGGGYRTAPMDNDPFVALRHEHDALVAALSAPSGDALAIVTESKRLNERATARLAALRKAKSKLDAVRHRASTLRDDVQALSVRIATTKQRVNRVRARENERQWDAHLATLSVASKGQGELARSVEPLREVAGDASLDEVERALSEQERRVSEVQRLVGGVETACGAVESRNEKVREELKSLGIVSGPRIDLSSWSASSEVTRGACEQALARLRDEHARGASDARLYEYVVAARAALDAVRGEHSRHLEDRLRSTSTTSYSASDSGGSYSSDCSSDCSSSDCSSSDCSSSDCSSSDCSSSDCASSDCASSDCGGGSSDW